MNTIFNVNILFDIIGLAGVACYIAGFVGLQIYQWQPQSYRYLICNSLGAILTLVSLMYAFNLASFVSQIVWLVISVVSIYKVMKNQATKQTISQATNQDISSELSLNLTPLNDNNYTAHTMVKEV